MSELEPDRRAESIVVDRNCFGVTSDLWSGHQIIGPDLGDVGNRPDKRQIGRYASRTRTRSELHRRGSELVMHDM
jgi:hypothetical protein